ncbi:MAG: amino acid permease [Spirochaetes bacterium]|nr:amino acid permease [Spirochaetota bacterium]
MNTPHNEHIKKTLGLFDVVMITIGIVIGSGIFKLPGYVAKSSPNEFAFILAWIMGGAMSIIGALCYAELASAYPNAGGDYYFIHRAYGDFMSFLFAWARMAVIQTGSIAFLGFFIGDFLSEVYSLGSYSSSIYAIITVVLLTAINVVGIKQGKWAQNLFTAAIVISMLMIIAIGFGGTPLPRDASPHTQSMSIGMAMVFVLLAFGGWNEAAYVSAEVKNPEKNIVKSLIIGLIAVTAIYLLMNIAYLRILGIKGMAASSNVAIDFVKATLGEKFTPIITLTVVFAVLSTTNATIISGGRGIYALGRDFKVFRVLGKWNDKSQTPAIALIVQGLISIALILIANKIDRNTGFETMVAYTTPVFWFFFFLAGVSIFILRHWDIAAVRPFKVPLYPIIPILFVAIGMYMLNNGFDYIRLLPQIGMYSGVGALIGVAVLILGIPLYILNNWLDKSA